MNSQMKSRYEIMRMENQNSGVISDRNGDSQTQSGKKQDVNHYRTLIDYVEQIRKKGNDI